MTKHWLSLVVAAAVSAGLYGCTTTTSYEQNDPSDPSAYGENDDPLGNEAPTVRTLHSAFGLDSGQAYSAPLPERK